MDGVDAQAVTACPSHGGRQRQNMLLNAGKRPGAVPVRPEEATDGPFLWDLEGCVRVSRLTGREAVQTDGPQVPWLEAGKGPRGRCLGLAEPQRATAGGAARGRGRDVPPQTGLPLTRPPNRG